MEKKSIYGYFFFGTAVRYLQDASAGFPIFEAGYVLDNINLCLNELDRLELTVTKNASWDLIKFRDKLMKIRNKKAALTQKQAKELNEICHTLRPTLLAELQTHEAYIITPKRFDTDKLLNDIASLMSPNIFSSLPEITQYDLMEAGKCIAFERPTAAAFHLLRATEAVLRHFYCTLIRTKHVPNLLWGDMVQDLRTRKKTKQHTTLYNNLDNIRNSYRNPTQHPEAIYDIHEAQDLLPLCFEVITRMTKILS
jgi:hypothetical protein